MLVSRTEKKVYKYTIHYYVFPVSDLFVVVIIIIVILYALLYAPVFYILCFVSVETIEETVYSHGRITYINTDNSITTTQHTDYPFPVGGFFLLYYAKRYIFCRFKFIVYRVDQIYGNYFYVLLFL